MAVLKTEKKLAHYEKLKYKNSNTQNPKKFRIVRKQR